MNKVLFLLLFLMMVMISVPGVRAEAMTGQEVSKTFVCLVGKDYWPLLQYQGYTLKNNNVNFYQPGTYFATYSKNQMVTEVTKRIIVLDEATLTTQGYYETRLQVISAPSTLSKLILASLSIDDGHTVFVYSIYDNADREKGATIIMAMLEDNSILWQKTLRQNVYGTISHLATDGETIVGVGDLYNELTQSDGWLVEADMAGNIISDETYGGSGYDYFRQAVVTGNEFVVSMRTNSTDAEFVGAKNGYDTCLAVIGRKNKAISSITNLGTPGDDEPTGFTFDGSHYYLIQHTLGVNQSTRLLKVRNDGTIAKINNFNFPLNFKIIAMKQKDEGEMYFLCNHYSYQYQRDIISLYRFNNELSLQEQDTYVYAGDSLISGLDFHFLRTGETAILYRLQKKTSSGWIYGYAMRIKKDSETVAQIENYTDRFIPYFGFTAGTISVLASSEVTNEIGVASNNSLRVLSLGSRVIDEEETSVNGYDVIMNNEQMSHEPARSHLYYDPDVYGTYQLDYYFESSSMVLAYYLNVYVDLNSSVSTGEVYDRGIRIRFNGEAMLNDVKIIPGHVIEDAGDYTLEIIGLNNLHKFITFSISDLSLNGDETVVKRPEAGNMEVSAPEPEPGLPVAYDEQQTPSKPIDLSAVSNWFFAFPVISTLIILLSIFKRKYER